MMNRKGKIRKKNRLARSLENIFRSFMAMYHTCVSCFIAFYLLPGTALKIMRLMMSPTTATAASITSGVHTSPSEPFWAIIVV